MSGVLAVIDFPSIKRYVFGTEPVREIRGASAIVDTINRKIIPERLKQRFETAADITFAGGGAAMVVIEGIDLGRADKFMAELREVVLEQTAGGIGIDWGLAEYDMSDDAGFPLAVRRAHLDMAGRPSMAGPLSISNALLRECDSCAAAGSVGTWQDGEEEPVWLCTACARKREYRHAGKAWQELTAYLGLPGKPSDHRPSDFEALARTCPREGYLALIYIDGDSMGEIVKRIPDRAQYKVFSEAVDTSLRNATYLAVEAWLRREKPSNGPLPLDILLLGGDDLVLVTRADMALRLATDILAGFVEESKKALRDKDFFDDNSRKKGLSASAGVAVFRRRQPFRVALDQAENLLASAKHAKAEAKSESPYVDLADISQTRFVDLDHIRRLELGVGSKRELTLWPMCLEDARKFDAGVRKLAEAGVSRQRIAALAQRAGGTGNTTFECMRIVARAKEKERIQLNRFFEKNGMWPLVPWREEKGRRRTGLLDLNALFALHRKPEKDDRG